MEIESFSSSSRVCMHSMQLISWVVGSLVIKKVFGESRKNECVNGGRKPSEPVWADNCIPYSILIT